MKWGVDYFLSFNHSMYFMLSKCLHFIKTKLLCFAYFCIFFLIFLMVVFRKLLEPTTFCDTNGFRCSWETSALNGTCFIPLAMFPSKITSQNTWFSGPCRISLFSSLQLMGCQTSQTQECLPVPTVGRSVASQLGPDKNNTGRPGRGQPAHH